SQSQVDGRQAAQECGQLAAVPVLMTASVQLQPAAKVNDSGQSERDCQPRRKRPGAQRRVKQRIHGRSLSSVRLELVPTGGRPEGRKLTRKSTKAVISSGPIWDP